jgi:hypothetical protein
MLLLQCDLEIEILLLSCIAIMSITLPPQGLDRIVHGTRLVVVVVLD